MAESQKEMRLKEETNSIERPIDAWREIIHSGMSYKSASAALGEIYDTNYPKIAEIITTGYCPFKCLHCIYPSDYAVVNEALSFDNWSIVLKKLYNDLGIKIFIHSGRVMDDAAIRILSFLRDYADDISLGIINDGISMKPYIEHIRDIKPDWMDISIDGLELAHDLQRNSNGRFLKTIESLNLLIEEKVTPKINVLTTLTKINVNEAPHVISFFNSCGLKNFFISPVIDFKPWKSNDHLTITDDEWVAQFTSISKNLANYKDTFTALCCFEANQLAPFVKKGILSEMSLNISDTSIDWSLRHQDNDLCITFEPFSLVGVKECVVSPGGKIIFNKSMATGRIEENYLIGDALNDDLKDVYRKLRTKPLFSHYTNELEREINILERSLSDENCN